MSTTDCFQVAVNLALYEQLSLQLKADDKVHVVHGLPVGRGPENEGKRYWHAWIEVTRRIHVPKELVQTHSELVGLLVEGRNFTVTTVLDRSHGQDLTLPREAYYSMGRLNDEHVWRFGVLEARRELRDREHYGPWVDDWEDYEGM